MNITYCAGIIVWRVNPNNEIEFFLCTPGGPLWENKEQWNFPKGQIEKGEEVFDCAKREFKEETNIDLIGDNFVYHGAIKQRTDKYVHVFSHTWQGEQLGENCFSNLFTWTDGKDYPEIKAYAWLTLEELKEKGGIKVYYPIFEQIIKNFHEKQ